MNLGIYLDGPDAERCWEKRSTRFICAGFRMIYIISPENIFGHR